MTFAGCLQSDQEQLDYVVDLHLRNSLSFNEKNSVRSIWMPSNHD